MEDIKSLKQKRGRIKGSVTRILTYTTSEGQKTVLEATARLEKLKELWDNFEDVQNAIIESKPEANEEELNNLVLENEAEGQIFEENYFAATAKLQEIITPQAAQRAAIAQNDQADNNIQAVEGNQVLRRTKPKLPGLKLPEFSGDFTKWIFFKNSFETTIHNDTDLEPIHKHQHLISVLQGEARQVIEGFTISNDNYESAWNLLKETYDNTMLIIETHLDTLLQFPNITKENKADSIRQFVWHIHSHMKSLESLKQPVDQWETMLIHLAKKKLDFAEQRDWQNIVKDRTPENMPKMEEFLKFLNDRCHTLRLLNQGKSKQTPSEKPSTQKKQEKKVSLTTTSANCKICEGSHAIYRCDDFLKQSISERLKTVREKKLCINCLNSGHMAKDCRSSTCKKCSSRHNTLLHRESEGQSDETSPSDSQVVSCCSKRDSTITAGTSTNFEDEDASMNIFYTQKQTSTVILSTVRVYAHDSDGNLQTCRALLDPGSQTNLITASFARKLKLSCKSEDRPITGIGQTQTRATKTTELRIKSTQSEFTATLQCLILPNITDKLPQCKLDVKKIALPKDVRLADPNFYEPAAIDLLIGSGLYWKILCGTPKNRIKGQPALQDTKFGWIIGGEMLEANPESSEACLTVTNDMLHQQIERFWTQEELAETKHYSEEEKACEKYFGETFRRDSDGRFVVRLPTRSNVKLGDSKDFAWRRFISLERRFEKNPEIKVEYAKFMNDYLEQKHMSLVPSSRVQESESYVLPHQAVLRPDSVTTKLRVVFDASAKTTLGTSLNDKLMAGPNLQKNLIDIILRFRACEYVVTADVAQMFRQILIDEKDRPLQQILWRENPEETVKVFELNTVTYGTNSAPYLAMRCLKQLATDDGKDLPRAAQAILEDCYMDDVLSGARTINKAITLQKELSQLLQRGQFYLRKWRSNDQRILMHLADQCKTDELLTIDKEGALKTLGLLWDARSDSLQYEIKLENAKAITKRVVLSKIAQVFDPLGLLAPLLIKGKIIMQKLWLYDIEWDQSIPQELSPAWEDYYGSLEKINSLQVPRNIIPANKSTKFDIFGFGDASERAYGACLYAVSTDDQEIVHSHLICAKTKVAPLKTVSIPRLELEAALLLSRLYAVARNAYGEQIGNTRLWSDSTVVLGWLKTPPNKLKMFVANRVAKIQDITRNIPWHHVPTNDNPADLLSRGVSIDTLTESNLWWHGPHWLTEESQWPAGMEEPEVVLPELKTAAVTLLASEASIVLARYPTYSKLTRVIAYCMRFRHNASGKKRIGTLTVEELNEAENIITRMVQRDIFAQDYDDLMKNRNLSSKSKLRALDPFMDEKGLIRVGGRLRHSSLSMDRKHPVILPAKHHVTGLIMREVHVRLHHCPPEQLLSVVRYQYWPISGRREARKVVKNCLNCFRLNPTTPDVKMGDLPKQRVTGYDRPFTNAGIDYAGPIQVRESRRRGRIHISKGYIAIFTCLSTKAVHLELVSDMTTAAFLAALSRFTARRGICSQMFSDNGTNFVGAARELREVYALLEKDKDEIQTNLAQQRIKWNFIPPRAPHFGGLWEAAVKVTKRHFYSVTQGRVLTFEEYATLLAEIEAILNSRPLTPISSDPSDLSALTPSHFLIGDSLIQPARNNYLEIPENRLTRWQHIQKLSQQFWSRWQAEYLQELQRRNKWAASADNIKLNTMVLLKEDHVPPLQWVIGRVTAIFPGSDGVVRVVSVKTRNGEFKRSVKKVCPIPIDDSEEN